MADKDLIPQKALELSLKIARDLSLDGRDQIYVENKLLEFSIFILKGRIKEERERTRKLIEAVKSIPTKGKESEST